MSEKEFLKKHFRLIAGEDSTSMIEVEKHIDSDWTRISKQESNQEITLTSKLQLQMLYHKIGELLGVNDK